MMSYLLWEHGQMKPKEPKGCHRNTEGTSLIADCWVVFLQMIILGKSSGGGNLFKLKIFNA